MVSEPIRGLTNKLAPSVLAVDTSCVRHDIEVLAGTHIIALNKFEVHIVIMSTLRECPDRSVANKFIQNPVCSDRRRCSATHVDVAITPREVFAAGFNDNNQ